MQHFTNYDLKNHTSFKIGGIAENVYFPQTIDEFIDILKNLNNPIILGGMSNILVSSAGVKENLILTKKLNNYEVTKSAYTMKTKKSKGEIIDMWYIVTVTLNYDI